MKFKLLLAAILIIIVVVATQTASANKQVPIVWNGCTIAINGSCNGADLSRFGFYYQTLRLTNFTCTNCYMRGAGMWSINLRGSDFSGSDLREASFAGANLTDVNFSGADLSYTILTNAKLTGSNGLIFDDKTILCHTYMPDSTVNNRNCP